MLNARRFVIQQIYRQFSTNNVNLNIARTNRYMNKFINKHKSERDPLDFSNLPIFGSTKNKVSSHVNRRINVLNNIFMQHITDLLSTGEIEPEILKRNIEISHVQVYPDFKLINIFWIDNDIDIKPDTPEILKKCSYRLRHELCQLHIIGKIPAIQFVKCRGVNEIKEIEQKLKTLDFGEDYVPSIYPNTTKHTFTAKTSLNTKEKDTKNKNLEDTIDTFSVTLPEMRHNVFDLNHHRIMTKIKSALNKSHATLKKHVIDTQSSLTPISKLELQNEFNFLTSAEQQEQFSQFLAQRRKDQRYKNKQKYCKENIYNVPGDEDVEEEEEEEEDYGYDVCNDYDTNDMHEIDNYYKDYINRETEDKC